MRRLLALAVALLAIACQDTICHCPPENAGAGWCLKPGTGPSGCGKLCPMTVPCPGYCVPDGGYLGLAEPYRCDGGGG
jgi:hypothetical protein